MSILTDEIRTDLADRHVEGDTRDEAIIYLVTEHAMSLNRATKAYAEWAKEEGMVPDTTSHKTEAMQALADRYPADQWDAKAVKDAVVELAAEFSVAESTARDYCKAYSEQLGVAHPVINPREAIFAWFAEHDGEATKGEFMAYAVDELGRSQSNANEYWKGYELHLYLTSL